MSWLDWFILIVSGISIALNLYVIAERRRQRRSR